MNQDLAVTKIKNIIETKLLVDTSALEPDSDLEISLGIDPELDFPLLVSQIEQEFDISDESAELLNQATTLQQLANIVIEETELG
jgi:hypothetical protein